MRKGWEYKRWKEVLTIINGKNQSAVVDEMENIRFTVAVELWAMQTIGYVQKIA